MTDCWLNESGVWVDVPDTRVEIQVGNEVTSLISYSMVVVAAKAPTPGSSFLGDYLHSGNRDFLQVPFIYVHSRVHISEAVL